MRRNEMKRLSVNLANCRDTHRIVLSYAQAHRSIRADLSVSHRPPPLLFAAQTLVW